MRAMLVLLFFALIVMLLVFLFTKKHNPNFDKDDDDSDEEDARIIFRKTGIIYAIGTEPSFLAEQNTAQFGSHYRRQVFAKNKPA